MTESACKSRVLIKDGRWQVPIADRPSNWRSILDDEAIVQVIEVSEFVAKPTDAEILGIAINAADVQALSAPMEQQHVCTVEWCTEPMGNMRFMSEDDECVIGLCEKHSEMSAWFSCDGKSPKEVAEKFGSTQTDVIAAVRVEMLGLWLEHKVS